MLSNFLDSTWVHARKTVMPFAMKFAGKLAVSVVQFSDVSKPLKKRVPILDAA